MLKAICCATPFGVGYYGKFMLRCVTPFGVTSNVPMIDPNGFTQRCTSNVKRSPTPKGAAQTPNSKLPMNVQQQAEAYINSQPEPKRSDLHALHRTILRTMPNCKLWFLDGKNPEGKVVSNPNIGYGTRQLKYAGGTTKEFYRIGLSANTGGISVYIMGLEDKTYLAKTYGDKLGKASITGYCIKFKALKDIHEETLETAIRHGAEAQH